ncbi:MAG TPA: DUF11 domain-containing protein [Solirubrobacteraceae bacterium]|nr:DUF11 domain-containing protein [Solirubrobacteraceae bacterium]
MFAVTAAPAYAQSGYFVTFAARVCPDYSDIFANKARNNIVESLKDLGPNTQYGTSGVLVNPAYEDQYPQTLCQPLPGWQFTLGTDYESRAVTGDWGSLSKVTNAYSTSIVTQASTPLLDNNAQPVPGQTIAGATTIELTNAQRRQASNSSLWVQGGTPTDPVLAQPYPGPEYGFGTLRCATDNVNGDNVEYVFFPSGVRHVFCYAYYVKPPPTTGVITIRKQVTGLPSGANPAFPFNGTISFDPSGFQLTDGASMTFYRAGGSDWTVTEGPVAGYALTSLVCTNGAGTPASTFDISGGTATIHLAALSYVTCTYTNHYVPPSGGLTIRKITRGGVGQFSFDVTPVGGGTTHTVTATTTQQNVPVNAVPSLVDLAPGTYTIDEHQPETNKGDWDLDSVNCNSVRRSTTHSFQVTIVAGQQVTCLFENSFTPAGAISIAKVTEGAVGTVAFVVQPLQGSPAQFLQSATTTTQGTPADATPRTPADATDHLPLGSYRVVEETPPSTPAGAWALVSIVCDQQLLGFAQGATVVTLTADNPSVRCVYTDLFTPTPPPEPGPEPPEPLPPQPTPTPTPTPPPAPNPDEPSAPWTDLSVTKTASPPSVVTGSVVTYRITVKNHGPNDATRVVLGDKPAAGAVVLSARSSTGRCAVRHKPVPILCQLGIVRPGARVTITVRVRVSKASSRFKNFAAVGTATYDPRLTNNVAHAAVAVVAPPPAAVTG